MDELVNSLVCEKLQACIEVNRRNKLTQSACSTFSQHFSTQVSPHYIQLDPIYYGSKEIIYLKKSTKVMQLPEIEPSVCR